MIAVDLKHSPGKGYVNPVMSRHPNGRKWTVKELRKERVSGTGDRMLPRFLRVTDLFVGSRSGPVQTVGGLPVTPGGAAGNGDIDLVLPIGQVERREPEAAERSKKNHEQVRLL